MDALVIMQRRLVRKHLAANVAPVRQFRHVDAHVVIQLVLILEILPAHIALVLADRVVIMVLPLLLAGRLDRADKLLLQRK